MALQFQIVIEPPDTKSNWTTFNRDCEDLNSDFLMQPINEADYDSETQACVDARTGGPRSFYDHYVTKRRKKKGVRGLGVEHPAGKGHGHQLRVTPTTSVGEGGENTESNEINSTSEKATAKGKQTAQKRKQLRQAEKRANQFVDPQEGMLGEATVAALVSPTESQPTPAAAARVQGTAPKSTVNSGTFLSLPTNTTRSAKAPPKPNLGSNMHPEDFLDVPNKITAAKGALNNAAIRRIACGRNPTPVWNAPTGFKGKLPETTLVPSSVEDSTSSPQSVNTEIIILNKDHVNHEEKETANISP